jgi:hypothetical protein
MLKPVLWILIGFNTDPNPAFQVNANTDPDIVPDLDPGISFSSFVDPDPGF